MEPNTLAAQVTNAKQTICLPWTARDDKHTCILTQKDVNDCWKKWNNAMHTEEIKSKHEESVPSLVATGEEEVRVFESCLFFPSKEDKKRWTGSGWTQDDCIKTPQAKANNEWVTVWWDNSKRNDPLKWPARNDAGTLRSGVVWPLQCNQTAPSPQNVLPKMPMKSQYGSFERRPRREVHRQPGLTTCFGKAIPVGKQNLVESRR